VNYFIRRPIFAAVCSMVIMLVGLIAIPTLPVSQYPQIAPPTVTVSATYVGANAQTLEATVTTPLEEAINGVAGLHYMSSTSTSNGTVSIVCVFNLGTNLDIASTDVQNAANGALGLLPAAVKNTGLTIRKNSGSFVMAFAFYSDNSRYDNLWLANYADVNLVDALKRVKGVGDVRVFGDRKYAMRLWIDPKKLAANGLGANDVVGRAVGLGYCAGPSHDGLSGPAGSSGSYIPGGTPLPRVSFVTASSISRRLRAFWN